MKNGQKIGELLRACRERAKLNQKELSLILGLDRTTIVKIESGDIKNPSYALVKEWARVTSCQDMIGIDLTGGRDGWKRLTALEAAAKTAKQALEVLNFKNRKV